MSKVRDFAEKKDTSIPDVILKATKSSVFRINEKLHNGKQGFALTIKRLLLNYEKIQRSRLLTYDSLAL